MLALPDTIRRVVPGVLSGIRILRSLFYFSGGMIVRPTQLLFSFEDLQGYSQGAYELPTSHSQPEPPTGTLLGLRPLRRLSVGVLVTMSEHFVYDLNCPPRYQPQDYLCSCGLVDALLAFTLILAISDPAPRPFLTVLPRVVLFCADHGPATGSGSGQARDGLLRGVSAWII